MMRAKLQVNKVSQNLGGSETIEMSPVSSKPYGPNGESEDNTYARYSPGGAFSLTISNPALAGKFKPGQKFYADFTEAAE